MPKILPKYTRILDLRNNEIASVAPLEQNPYYKNVWDLYLDNNKISNIGVLEGSYWLRHFRTLSLKKNKLRKVSSVKFTVYTKINNMRFYVSLNRNIVRYLQQTLNKTILLCSSFTSFTMFTKISVHNYLCTNTQGSKQVLYVWPKDSSVISLVIFIRRHLGALSFSF